jgi:sugar lactone lactonase YvrE
MTRVANSPGAKLTRRSAGAGMAALLLAGSGQAADSRQWRSGHIYRLAGTGEAGFSGDGGPATAARLWGPAGADVDAAGRVLIADLKNSAIRQVENGTITTVAGTGIAGFSGDGGLATSAQLARPEGVAIDRSGNIYIADSDNNRIRRVDAKGIIETFAGGGTEDPRRFEGPARAVKLNHPAGVVADGMGTIFFNDYGHEIVCAVTPDGELRRVAGDGTYGFSGDGGAARQAQLNDVYGIGLDPHGNLYICDSLNFAIRKVTHDGTISTVLGNGRPAALAEFVPRVLAGLGGVPHAKGTIGPQVPHGVAADAQGNVFVAETGLHRLRLLAARDGRYFTIAGSGRPGRLVPDGTPALEADLDVHGVRVGPNGMIVFLDFRHNVIYLLK